MKVVLINSVCGIGSTGRIAIDLYNKYESNGIESIVAYGRFNAPSGYNTLRIGNNFSNYFHVFVTRLLDRHGFSSRLATKKLIDKLDKFKPDILHLHNLHGYYLNIELIFDYIKKNNIKVIWTFHDCWAFTGHCAHFDSINCDKWIEGCSQCPIKGSYPKSYIIDASYSNYKKKKEIFNNVLNMTIVTPSSWLAEKVKMSFLENYPIRVINNGIDLDVFKPKTSKKKDELLINDKFIILGVASIWTKEKGFNDFIKLSKCLDKDEVIILVGLSADQNRNLPSNIIGLSKTSNVYELAELYSIADVFVNTSYEDTFPTTNLEALACGTPIITYNTGGSPESIDESCGYVINKGNINGLVDAIRKCKANNFATSACIERSRRYDKQDRYNEYVKLTIDINNEDKHD
jgi:glycosyltransferase involved in cell wall biosynthesis